MKLFLDTGAFVARLDKKDAHNKKAVATFEAIMSGELKYQRLYTSNYILNEAVTHVLYRTKIHQNAVKILDLITASKYIEMLWVTEEIQSEAIELFRKYNDQLISITDCTSAVLMEKNGIDSIFTFDTDFEILNFRVIP